MEWPDLLRIVKSVQANGGTFRYLIDGRSRLEGPEIPIGHKIVARWVLATGELIGMSKSSAFSGPLRNVRRNHLTSWHG